MSVRKIRNAWWVDFRHDRIRYRVRSPQNTRAGAAAYELVLRQRLARGEPVKVVPVSVAPLVPTFQDFAEHWFETYVTTNNKPSGQRAKRLILRRHLVPAFGRWRLDQITAVHIEQFKANKIKDGLSPKTINNLLGVLSRCLRSAEEWLDIKVVRKFHPLKVPPQSFDFLSVEESNRLLDVIDDEFWYTMILMGLRTGMRVGEMVGLHWTDIDLDQGRLTVRRTVWLGRASSPKNNRERHIPLTPELWGALKRFRASRPFDRIVFGQSDDRYAYQRMPYKALRRYCDRAGLRHFGWHILRHSFASQLVARGVPIRAVQELLGHADITMTMRYAHLGPSTLRSSVELLDCPTGQFGQQAVNADGRTVTPPL